jgi:phosphatidyl-myo-inositol alpha-mannosyltransferase
MKIAFFSKYLPSDKPSGVSVQVDRLATALVGRGHTLTCFSFSPKPDGARYNVVTLPDDSASKTARKFLPAKRFRKIDIGDFDICHFHGDDYLVRGSRRRIRTFYGSALAEALHAGRAGRFLYQSLFYAFEWVSCIRKGSLVGISEATRRALPLVKQVIPCGVPLDRYNPGATPKSPSPSILFLGDFNSRKRGALLLDVFSREILPAFPDCRLTVIGPAAVSAPNVICKSALSEPELIEEYRRAWVYCMPSSYEGFGVPAIEAMACGTPVVACDNSGSREVIDDGRNGLLCGTSTLGTTICKIISDNIQRDRIAAEGLIKAREFDMTTIAGRYEELYKRIISSNKRS